MLAASDIAEARRASDELTSLAERFGMELLTAMAQHAKGEVSLAEGDARGAIDPLRQAQDAWLRVGAPYLSARIRLLLAQALRSLGVVDARPEAAPPDWVELPILQPSRNWVIRL
jgi:hypothetical protein